MQTAFADPVLDSQRTFRAVLEAMAHPGRIGDVGGSVAPPPPVGAASAAVALTLCDFETTLWADPSLDAFARAWLCFHTGAPLVKDPGRAAFALVVDIAHLPPLGAFYCGSDERPDGSATVIVQVDALEAGAGVRLTGPGIVDECFLTAQGVPDVWWAELSENRALFPRGVDVVLAAGSRLAALPRTTRVER